MAGKVSELEERKRQVLTRSDLYRQSMESEFRDLKTATAWVPKTVKMARTIYPVLLLVAPLLGYTFSRKRASSSAAEGSNRRGILASALAGYKLFRTVKPVWEGLRNWRRSNGQ